MGAECSKQDPYHLGGVQQLAETQDGCLFCHEVHLDLSTMAREGIASSISSMPGPLKLQTTCTMWTATTQTWDMGCPVAFKPLRCLFWPETVRAAFAVSFGKICGRRRMTAATGRNLLDSMRGALLSEFGH